MLNAHAPFLRFPWPSTQLLDWRLQFGGVNREDFTLKWFPITLMVGGESNTIKENTVILSLWISRQGFVSHYVCQLIRFGLHKLSANLVHTIGNSWKFY